MFSAIATTSWTDLALQEYCQNDLFQVTQQDNHENSDFIVLVFASNGLVKSTERKISTLLIAADMLQPPGSDTDQFIISLAHNG